MNNQSFLGKGWSFPPEFKKDGVPTVMISEEENIRQSLQTLMSTTPGERIHRYDYGCPIKQYAFEIMDVTTQTIMRELIERSVILFESRISLNKVSFDIKPEGGMIWIHLDYTIRQTNRRSNMVYPFYLNEGTEISR